MSIRPRAFRWSRVRGATLLILRAELPKDPGSPRGQNNKSKWVLTWTTNSMDPTGVYSIPKGGRPKLKENVVYEVLYKTMLILSVSRAASGSPR